MMIYPPTKSILYVRLTKEELREAIRCYMYYHSTSEDYGQVDSYRTLESLKVLGEVGVEFELSRENK